MPQGPRLEPVTAEEYADRARTWLEEMREKVPDDSVWAQFQEVIDRGKEYEDKGESENV